MVDGALLYPVVCRRDAREEVQVLHVVAIDLERCPWCQKKLVDNSIIKISPLLL